MDIRAPAAQEEGTRSQVLRWLKSVGEQVTEHEPLIELETDKVTVEVASPGAGVLTEILKQEQEEVAPGELLGQDWCVCGGHRACRCCEPQQAHRAVTRCAYGARNPCASFDLAWRRRGAPTEPGRAPPAR